MRSRGTCIELMRMRPHDHIGWVFDGRDEFDALAVQFLTEGAERGERLMYVAEDPDVEALAPLTQALQPDQLQVASIAEVYGASGIVDAAVQRATFADALAGAVTEGFTGIRVAADNTPLALDEERLAAWISWEVVADDFMSENAVTGLCAFNRSEVDIEKLRHLATLHPLSSASCPQPQFHLFADDGALWVEGEVDAFALENARKALEQLPAKTKVVVDLTETVMVTKSTLSAVGWLARSGFTVTIRGAAPTTRRLADDLECLATLRWADA